MSRGARAAGIVVTVLLLTIVLPVSWGVGQEKSSVTVTIISPPADLILPVDQAVAVRYCANGAITTLELWHDNTLLVVDPVEAGQEISHAWAPVAVGLHYLTVRALENSTLLATAERRVVAAPRGSPIRLSIEEGDK